MVGPEGHAEVGRGVRRPSVAGPSEAGYSRAGDECDTTSDPLADLLLPDSRLRSKVSPHISTGTDLLQSGTGRPPRMSTNPSRILAARPVCPPGRGTRHALGLLALGLAGVLATACILRPDPRGFGTHSQLGLGECSFRKLSGKPCPACGMTTAFAWSVRGRVDRAWRANPAGSVIAPMVLILIPWLASTSITGRPWPFRTADVPLVGVVLLGVALALANWAVRLLWLLR